MTPMKKAMVFSALILAPLVIATGIWLGAAVWKAVYAAKFLAAFSELQDGKSKMTPAQVENLLGQPVRIDHAESTGITGDVYHYATYPAGGDLKVIFVNGVLLQTAILPYKSS